MNPTRIQVHTREFRNLTAVAKMLEAISPNEAFYRVQDVYFDFGQDWMWTTIVRYGYRECQILSPRQWEGIMLAKTVDDLADCVNEIISDKYFGDK